MNCIYSSSDSWLCKTGADVDEIPCYSCPFNISTKNFNLQSRNPISSITFTEVFKASDKWAYEVYLQKKFTNIPFSI